MNQFIDWIAGRASLVFRHCAGLVDIVVPVWVGVVLIGQYGFDSQCRVGFAALFLVLIVFSSLATTPGMCRSDGSVAVPCTFSIPFADHQKKTKNRAPSACIEVACRGLWSGNHALHIKTRCQSASIKIDGASWMNSTSWMPFSVCSSRVGFAYPYRGPQVDKVQMLTVHIGSCIQT